MTQLVAWPWCCVTSHVLPSNASVLLFGPHADVAEVSRGMSLHQGCSDGEVVVVTGAAGFLGLKIVELLNTRGVNIQEIRGLDICHSEPSFFLQNAQGGQLSYRRADICNYEEVSLCDKIEGKNE